MTNFLIVVHVIVCTILILIVLLQGGKGAQMGAAFGGASQTVFGSAGPTDFLGMLTTWAAVIFMVTSLTLAYLSSGKTAPSVVDNVPIAAEAPVPGVPPVPAGIDQALPPVDQSTEMPAIPAPVQENVPAPENETQTQ
jgi:preprotein translocase subunit SecG